MGVGGKILLVLVLKLLDKVVDQPIVEILTAQVSIASGALTSKIPSSMVRRETSKAPPPSPHDVQVVLPRIQKLADGNLYIIQ